MHFLPGAVSSSLVILIASIERMSRLLDSSFLTLCRSRFSNTVAAESGIVFLKNDLSKTCMSRLTGGKNSSGKFDEFIFKKFLDQVANFLVHRAMQISVRLLVYPKRVRWKHYPLKSEKPRLSSKSSHGI